jgi:hypothetical protein
MNRTMKQVMLDKMTTQYLRKKGYSIAEVQAMPAEKFAELNLPHVMNDHIPTMDPNTNDFTVARAIATLGTESTATHAPRVIYTPEQEEKAEIEKIQEIVQEYIPEPAAEEVVESPVVTESEAAESPVEEVKEEVAEPRNAYTEEGLRRVIESVAPSTSYTTLLKRVKEALDPNYDYDEELLVALSKEYAAAEKAKK